MDNNNNDAMWSEEKTVGNGGASGILYVPKKFSGYIAKIIIPNNGSEDVITKKIGRGSCCGYLYVHKKHLRKKVTILILPKAKETD